MKEIWVITSNLIPYVVNTVIVYNENELHLIGKTKCMSKTSDCVVKHGTNFVTGMSMVVCNLVLERHNNYYYIV